MILQEIIYSILRSSFSFILLIILTRFMGKKAISQMTFFDFAVAITMGSAAANLALSSASAVYSATTTLIILALLTVLTDYIHTTNMRFSKLVESESVVLVSND